MSSKPEQAPDGGVRVVTHGCRLNAAESASILARAKAAGLNHAIVHNTCAVTAEAVRSARQAIRRSARENPGARIIVTGCAAHTDADALAAMPEVDAVIGNADKTRTNAYRGLPDFGVAASEKLRVGDLSLVREQAPHLAEAFEGKARAFLAVQNGCDHACTFCIIPTGRGASRSVPMGAVVERVRKLVAEGCAEIVLTGVDLTSYGGDLPGRPALGSLVQAILGGVPDLPRLRLSSIDSMEVDETLLDALDDPRLMPHLHLSLQHGHDLILKRMKRRHLREDALLLCEEARRRRPDMTFGADLIAGFPTEAEEHHAASVSLIGACGLTNVHVFPFSAREGTPAARMPPVRGDKIKRRAAELREEAARAKRAHLARRVGSADRAVVHHGRDAEGRRTGLCEDFSTVLLPADAVPGSLVDVTIERLEGDRLVTAGA